jgi:hypothetical protein
MVPFSIIFCWPNNYNRDELAEDFYRKASANIANFPLQSHDYKISLLENEDREEMVHVFVGPTVTDKESRQVMDFLKESGCKVGPMDSFKSLSITFDTVAPLLLTAGGSVIHALERKGTLPPPPADERAKFLDDLGEAYRRASKR